MSSADTEVAAGPPPGYREGTVGGAYLVARAADFEALAPILAGGTLHDWAGAQAGAQALQGRDVAWLARLPSGEPVVVRHSRHGGALAPVTGDLFLAPTRAPHELHTAVRLAAAGVPTPEVVAFAVYGAAGPLCRADVMTAYVEGNDLPAAWTAASATERREAILDAVAALLRALGAAGAQHPDLNVKNVLVTSGAGALRALVLDVDRVVFGTPGDPACASRNARRLAESVAKWRGAHGLDFAPNDWERLLARAGVLLPRTPAR